MSGIRFTTLWIYTILKPQVVFNTFVDSFTTLWIYTILKRNSSCTLFRACFTTLWIYTILKLFPLPVATAIVSLPYGFTLFSNTVNGFKFCQHVSLPYGFTLFSNFIITLKLKLSVSLPYGFTLFSNQAMDLLACPMFHYLMDLHYSQTSNKLRPLYSAGQIHKI